MSEFQYWRIGQLVKNINTASVLCMHRLCPFCWLSSHSLLLISVNTVWCHQNKNVFATVILFNNLYVTWLVYNMFKFYHFYSRNGMTRNIHSCYITSRIPSVTEDQLLNLSHCIADCCNKCCCRNKQQLTINLEKDDFADTRSNLILCFTEVITFAVFTDMQKF
jgi:hypothetical protein